MAAVDAAQLYNDIAAALEKNAPGGMIGGFVLAAELYDENGAVELHNLRSAHSTAWTILGMIDMLSYAVQESLQTVDDEDDD